MHKYNLGFIKDEDIYSHVKDTVAQYRKSIDLKEFNSNIIDPIKLTFDSKIYGQTMQQTIESELFYDFKPIRLMIWRTFTDTNLRALLALDVEK